MGLGELDPEALDFRDLDLPVRLDDSAVPLFPPTCPDPTAPSSRPSSSSAMAAAGVSPSSSPRLPSPPPFTEVQIGPKSPTVGDSYGRAGDKLSHDTDDGSTRRIRPGTKAADMASGPPLIPLSQLDSPFQLQEHLKALYHHYTKPDSSRTVVPITREVAVYLAEPPEGVERSLWLYELCRFLTMKVNNLIIAFFAEDPPCSAQTCPEMRASEWQYLCAVHDPPKSCCAIDYCCHTLDWATNILTSPRYFPSRLTLGSEAGGGPQASMRHLTNIFRRLYRIFAHAWFQHRGVFWQVEGHDGLYVFFKTVCDVYNLIPEDNYTIPAEAEGPEAHSQAQAAAERNNRSDGRRMTILRKEQPSEGAAAAARPAHEETSTTEPPSSVSTGATTRRHKHSPSTASSVATIVEGAEESEQHEQPQNAKEDEAEEPQTAKPAEDILEEPEEQQTSTTDTPSHAQETGPEEKPAEEQLSSPSDESGKSEPEESEKQAEANDDAERKSEQQQQATAEPDAAEEKETEKDETETETTTAADDQASASAASTEPEPEPEPAAKDS